MLNSANLAPNRYLPDPFPARWASDWGQDDIGPWMALTYKSVRQAFRWVRPGVFWMGSPKSEPERYDHEILHQVTLKEGYLLADTACTQALWQAVMGNNPANFKDDANNPVEQVSWDDVKQFIEKLNSLIAGLNACLPTEAQWEYACRAGKETPFSFGENITPEQVNCDGDYPYAEGKVGQSRGKTVPVKSLPANPWGLYEMHGNIWEWCQDWYGKYPADPGVEDPVGPPYSDGRVLRGGSWDYDGRRARSAFRLWHQPVTRLDRNGFRLALGQAASTR